ncbi:metallopeptidase family protein [Leucobacter allii]|uniref:Metallopeptidase family protein n=1 Tax=Leucobacter allii TaxID=2932247 RepID=A0ABY4FJZ2_9MICO|nr:metallopeptidase family protein [Leucobacter allii]UOQ56457.1 metallopeptidase family protein [Leucobacter allii]UOR00891.1 metallopeptidase family protein [Leucobacter allii]
MFGRERRSKRVARPVPRRHGRRPIRSSVTGASLPDPAGRFPRFEADARGAVEVLQSHFPDELRGVRIGFQTAPSGAGDSRFPLLYAVDRRARSIVLFRMPIQRARGLHVNDEEHRRYFVEHCVYLAVCEYLGREPWDLLPGRFDHY